MRSFVAIFALSLAGCGAQANCPECPEVPDCPEPTDGPPGATSAEAEAEPSDEVLDTRSVDAVLEEQGFFAWSDNTSIYRMHADHRFEMGPDAMSGRTLRGCWRASGDGADGHYEATGRLGWINGLQGPPAFRRLRFRVGGPHLAYETPMAAAPVYRSHFLMEEMAEVGAAEHAQATSACRWPEE